MDSGKCANQALDSEVIFGLQETAEALAQEIRARAQAIKNVPANTVTGGAQQERPMTDISDRIQSNLRHHIGVLDDALTSLRAFA